MKIAFQGEQGAFSEAAALQIKPDAQMIPCRAFEDVFDAVKGGPAGYGVVPIENSIGGSIHRNFDLLLEHELPIVGEVELPVVHHLMAMPGTTLERVRRIYSHPQALALRGIDLTKLESRPIPKRKWEYLFYVDLAAARDNLTCNRALAHLAEFAPSLRILGSYSSYKSPAVAADHAAPASASGVRV